MDGNDDPAGDLSAVNGFLGRLAMLSGLLTGGGLFLLTDWTIGLLPRIAVGISLCSLAFALKGMDQAAGDGQARSKWRWFRASAGALLLALALGMTGLIIR